MAYRQAENGAEDARKSAKTIVRGSAKVGRGIKSIADLSLNLLSGYFDRYERSICVCL